MRITQCVLSHWHHDHVGGLNELRQVCAADQGSGGETEKGKVEGGELKIYKYPLFDELFLSNETPRDSQSPELRRSRENRLLGSANDDQDVGQIHGLHDGQTLEVGDANSLDEEKLKLQVLHTPGHTSDHIALLITSSPADPSEVGTIFTGDAVLGHGTAVFEDLSQYMQSLLKMKGATETTARDESSSEIGDGNQPTRRKVTAFPAHGAVIKDAMGKIEEYIAHRAKREQEVLNVLAGGLPKGHDPEGVDEQRGEGPQEWSPVDIVKVVYKDVPESLHLAAQGGVVQVLSKLEREGRIEKNREGGRWRISKDGGQVTSKDEGNVEEPKSAL